MATAIWLASKSVGKDNEAPRMHNPAELTPFGRRILDGLDEAMQGCPRALYLECGASNDAPAGINQNLLATVEFVAGYSCLWISFFAFYSEPIARLLEAVTHCQQSGRVDEIEVCLLHVVEPARELLFEHLAETGFGYTEDGSWLLWRRLEPTE